MQWVNNSPYITIGFNSGDGSRAYTLPQSAFGSDVGNLINSSNVGMPGTFVFRVDQSKVEGKVVYKLHGVYLDSYNKVTLIRNNSEMPLSQ